jgi:hypothetical protein
MSRPPEDAAAVHVFNAIALDAKAHKPARLCVPDTLAALSALLLRATESSQREQDNA